MWLHVITVALFLISSFLFARFIYIYPLSPSFDWNQASDSFFYIIIIASLAFFTHMVITWSFKLSLLLFLLSFIVSSLVELLGLSSGLMFGSLYYYNPSIEPRITDQLPLTIPLAWFIFCCLPLILLRPWLITKSSFKNSQKSHRWTMLKQVVFCSLFLTSCDFYLEPIFVYTGYWTWIQQGQYFGAPIMNFVGWFSVGLLVFSTFFAIQNRWFQHVQPNAVRLDRLIIGLFIFWVIVALTLIGYEFESQLPLLLTFVMIVTSLYLRTSKNRQRNLSVSNNK